MIVVFYISSVGGGGEEGRVIRLARFFMSRGVNVHIFAGPGKGFDVPGAHIHRIGFVGVLGFFEGLLRSLLLLWKTRVSCFFFFKRGGNLVGFFLERICPSILVYGSIANYWPTKQFLNFFFPSRAIAIHTDLAHQKYLSCSVRCVPIGIPIDVSQAESDGYGSARSSSDICRLLFVGGLGSQKRPERLLGVAESLVEMGFAFRLDILGEGEQFSDLERGVIDLGLEDFVFLHGRRDPREFYKHANFVVLTSAYEGLPNVVLEAGLFGCCVVSTSVGAVPSVLAEGRGLVLKEFSTTEYSNLLVENFLNGNWQLCGRRLSDYVRGIHDEKFMFDGYYECALGL